jgi:2-isopropylmalate synthase
MSATYEHLDPVSVGNERRILVSEMAGKSNVSFKAKELDLDFEKDPKAAGKIINAVKEMENNGYQFEDADGSFVLLSRKALGKYVPSFTLKSFRVSVEKDENGAIVSEATIKLDINGAQVHTVAEGDGPVNALDNSLRKALIKFYPEIADVSLMDFKVRVINAGAGTAAKVRVLIESKDSHSTWGTIGVSENLIDASWKALVDAVEYKLMKKTTKKPGRR